MSDEQTDSAAQLESVLMRALKSFAKSRPTMKVNTVAMVATHVAVRVASQFMRYDEFVKMTGYMWSAQRHHMTDPDPEPEPPEPPEDEGAATPSGARRRIHLLPPLQ